MPIPHYIDTPQSATATIRVPGSAVTTSSRVSIDNTTYHVFEVQFSPVSGMSGTDIRVMVILSLTYASN